MYYMSLILQVSLIVSLCDFYLKLLLVQSFGHFSLLDQLHDLLVSWNRGLFSLVYLERFLFGQGVVQGRLGDFNCSLELRGFLLVLCLAFAIGDFVFFFAVVKL